MKTREGRPIKLEGNPDHPVNEGGLDSATQASIFDLYNPDRLRFPMAGSAAKTWEDADAALKAALKQARPGSVRVLTGALISPTLKSVLKKFNETHKAKHHTMELSPREPVAEAYETAGGSRLTPTLRFEKADVVLSVDADFLGSWGNTAEQTKLFSKRRRLHIDGTAPNRLFVFECNQTLTGIASDSRFSILPTHRLAVLLGLANALGVSADGSFKTTLSSFSLEKVSALTGISTESFEEVAAALKAAKGKSIVVAGGVGADALEVQSAALLINQHLQNIGATIDVDAPSISGFEAGESASALLKDMQAGAVDVLIVQGANPLHSVMSSAFEAAISKVKTVVTVTACPSETAQKSHWALPESHFLEAWGDAEIRRGVISIQQPVIEPLFGSRSFGEMLARWTSDMNIDYREVVQNYWKQNVAPAGSNFQAWWDGQLRKGVYVSGASAKGKFTVNSAKVSAQLQSAQFPASSDDIQLVLYSSVNMGDGAQINNAWLQEIPDPISKVGWSNYAAMAPALADKLGVKRNSLVSVKVGNASVTLPVFVQPGLQPNVVAASVGYGRTVAGSIGTKVGHNVFPLAVAASNGRYQLSGQTAQVSKTAGTYQLATTQEEFSLQGRDQDILRQMTLSDFLKDPKASKKEEAKGHPESIYGEGEFV